MGTKGDGSWAGGEAGSRGAGQHRLQHPLQTTRREQREAAPRSVRDGVRVPGPPAAPRRTGDRRQRVEESEAKEGPVGTRDTPPGCAGGPGAQGASCGDRQRPPANSRRDLTGPSSSPSGSGPPVPLTPSAMAPRGHWGAASAGTLSQTHSATLDTEFAPKSLTKTKRFIKALCEITKAYCC